MRIYELMAALSELPSGAVIYCSGMLSVNDLRKCDIAGEGKKEAEMPRIVIERVCEVEAITEEAVYLNF